MDSLLGTYVHDHLAGAQFAVELLQDLQQQSGDNGVRALAGELLRDIEEDRDVLKQFAERLDAPSSMAKEAAAWLAQKLSRLKLSAQTELGAFESLEALCLGILGKLALWDALKALGDSDHRVATLDLPKLALRAQGQHARAGRLRLALARTALAPERPEIRSA